MTQSKNTKHTKKCLNKQLLLSHMHGVSTILYNLNAGFCGSVISVFSMNISNQADVLPQGCNYRSHYC